MKQKNMVLLALAIGCGLVAAFLTAKLGASNKGEMTLILVAAKNLDQGIKLEKPEELFVRKPFPKESVPPEFIDDITQMKGKVLQRTVRAGSHCTMADVTPRNTVDLPIDDKTGVTYKAMGLRVSPEKVVGGLVLPGARVNVVCVESLTNGKRASTMILQNVLVVAVDQTAVRDDNAGFIKNAQTVTMAVRDQEALVLALASSKGDVFLMLRSPGDVKVNTKLKPVHDYTKPNDEAGDDVVADATKIPVAKKTIPVGTKIENPDDLFEDMDWSGPVPEKFIVDRDLLKGKVATKEIVGGLPVVKEQFEGDVKPAAGVARATSRDDHTITFQVGGSTPYYGRYKNGKLEDGGIPANPVGPADSSTSPEIVPEKKDDKSDKLDK